jgi:hypothetical protein
VFKKYLSEISMLVWPIMVVIRNRSDAAIAIRLSVQRFSKKHHILPKKRGD